MAGLLFYAAEPGSYRSEQFDAIPQQRKLYQYS